MFARTLGRRCDVWVAVAAIACCPTVVGAANLISLNDRLGGNYTLQEITTSADGGLAIGSNAAGITVWQLGIGTRSFEDFLVASGADVFDLTLLGHA